MAQFNSLSVIGKKGNSIISSAWADTKWHEIGSTGEPAFQNSWLNYSVVIFPPAAFRRDAEGYVKLRGLVKSGSSTIFTLPIGYRPVYTKKESYLFFNVPSNNACGKVRIDNLGNLVMIVGTNSWLSLEGIYFLGEI